jgi:hypothetical protein
MSSFTKPVRVEVLNYRRFKLLEGFDYYRSGNPEDIISVPAGFETDFATTPRALWGILPPTGTGKNRYCQCSVLHDYLGDAACTIAVTRKEADNIFLESMLALKVNKFIAYLFYYNVRLFGKKYFKNTLKENPAKKPTRFS